MRTLREGELVISMPEPGPAPIIDLAAARRAILPAPGCLAVQVDPVREKHGGVLIPDTVGARLRADCGTVVAATPRGQGAGCRVQERMPEPGTRVLLRPYHGLWIEPFASIEGALQNVGSCLYRPTRSRVIVRPDEVCEQWHGLEIRGVDECHTGRVVAVTAGSSFVVGSRVVYSRYHSADGRTRPDRIDDYLVLDESRIYATLGPSDYAAGMVRFYGAGTDWRKSILMVQQDATWVSCAGWEDIQRKELPSTISMLTRYAVRHRIWASRASPDDASKVETVLADPDPRESLTFEMGDQGRERQLVPVAAVWAVVE